MREFQQCVSQELVGSLEAELASSSSAVLLNTMQEEEHIILKSFNIEGEMMEATCAAGGIFIEDTDTIAAYVNFLATPLYSDAELRNHSFEAAEAAEADAGSIEPQARE